MEFDSDFVLSILFMIKSTIQKIIINTLVMIVTMKKVNQIFSHPNFGFFSSRKIIPQKLLRRKLNDI